MARITRSPGIERAFDDVFPVPIKATRAPGTSDLKYPIGQLWVRTDTGQAYILVTLASGSATWSLASPGDSDVDTLTGDSGGAISPVSGNMTVAGGTNITTVGTAGTITSNLDAAITLATSVTSPTYTAAGAMAINMPAGAFDLTVKLADAAGAQKLGFTDSADVEVANLDSDGKLTVVNMDGIIGATTPAAGTFTTSTASTSVSSPIYTSTGAMAINMPAGAFDLTVKLADAAGAQKLSFTDSADVEVANLDSDGQLNLLSGDCVVTRSAASLNVTSQVTNSDNTAADSDAFVEVSVGGTSGGNPGVRFQISGGQNYSMGIDNADSDKLVICADNDLGTDVLVKMDEATKDFEISQGNLIIGTVAKQLQMNGGAATDFIGKVTLTAGTVTVANTNIAAGDRVFVTRSDVNGSTALGVLDVSITASTNFIIDARNPTDASVQTNDISVVDYFIVRQN